MCTSSFVKKIAACVCGLMVLNPAGDQEKSSVAYCSMTNHNFANIGHKNMNDHFNAKRLLYYNKIIIYVEQMKIMGIFVFEKTFHPAARK